jgi:AraC-type DNA-binding domain-containing proteins
MISKPIPLVKAAFKEQFSTAMLKNGIDPTIYFERVGLPTQELDDPESLIPLLPFRHLANIVAMEESIPDFAAQVAQYTPWHRVASLAPLISGSKTLNELLSTFCVIAPDQSSGVSFDFVKTDEFHWFICNRSINEHDAQMELYRITSMIQLVQLAAGPRWYPPLIQLHMQDTQAAYACRLLKNSHIAFLQVHSRIAVANTLLDLPVHLDIADSKIAENHNNVNAGFVESMRSVILTYLSSNSQDANCTIDLIAKAVGLPVRSLQRRLQEHGLKMSDMFNQAKFEIAHKKLADRDLSVAEVAYQMGYSDTSHFTRAFKKMAGMGPNKYRQQTFTCT